MCTERGRGVGSLRFGRGGVGTLRFGHRGAVLRRFSRAIGRRDAVLRGHTRLIGRGNAVLCGLARALGRRGALLGVGQVGQEDRPMPPRRAHLRVDRRCVGNGVCHLLLRGDARFLGRGRSIFGVGELPTNRVACARASFSALRASLAAARSSAALLAPFDAAARFEASASSARS